MITHDPADPRLAKGNDTEPRDQAEVYLALSPEQLAKGYLCPVRDRYIHATCGTETRMPMECAETHAQNPWYYSGTYCCHCRMHRPLSEFRWADGMPMAPSQWPDEELARVTALRAPAMRAVDEQP